ncbi:lactonase family protein [Pelosinus sp. sgz500959]|uniref:lactonase family protein n=1 Tax=Pelosinus sp. sgz500959 TaxID=3242472 RepID=UPI00366E973D
MFRKCIKVMILMFLFISMIIPVSAQEVMKSQQGKNLNIQTPKFAYVGSYTAKERDGHGKGIEVYRIDSTSGEWKSIQSVDGFNPAFLALDHEGHFLYAAHGDGTVVSAFAIDQESGQLTLLNQQATGGKNSVHLTVDPSGRFLLVANNTSGNITVLPINIDGSLADFSDLVDLPGKMGPNRAEQASSHPHQVSFDPSGHFVLVSDVGLDKIFVYSLDQIRGKLIANDPPSMATRSGAGPRHFAFHPTKSYQYVINGLDSTITTYQFDDKGGKLQPIQVMPTLSTAFVGNSAASEIMIAPSGKFLYGANRGPSNIGVFSIDQVTGTLTPIEWVSTQGKGPRFFALDPLGQNLYAANQNSDNIVIFRINSLKGTLIPTGQVIKTGSPTCIVFR